MRYELLHRALTDAETALPNRQALDLERDRLHVRSSRYGFPIGTITVTCHGCGEGVLQRFARAAALKVREADLLARTGPAELQLLVTHRDTEGLQEVVDRLSGVADDFAKDNLTIDVRCSIEEASGSGTDDKHPQSLANPWAREVSDAQRKVVLIVDDDAAQRQVFSKYLEFTGYRVVEAENGDEGARTAEDLAPALILLDISMPVLDGWGTMQRLRDDLSTASIPIVG